MQFNKIVLNEGRDNQVLLEPSYGKKQMELLANPMYVLLLIESVDFNFQASVTEITTFVCFLNTKSVFSSDKAFANPALTHTEKH